MRSVKSPSLERESLTHRHTLAPRNTLPPFKSVLIAARQMGVRGPVHAPRRLR